MWQRGLARPVALPLSWIEVEACRVVRLERKEIGRVRVGGWGGRVRSLDVGACRGAHLERERERKNPRGREREGERGREGAREIDREREGARERERERERARERQRERENGRERETQKERGGETARNRE